MPIAFSMKLSVCDFYLFAAFESVFYNFQNAGWKFNCLQIRALGKSFAADVKKACRSFEACKAGAFE